MKTQMIFEKINKRLGEAFNEIKEDLSNLNIKVEEISYHHDISMVIIDTEQGKIQIQGNGSGDLEVYTCFDGSIDRELIEEFNPNKYFTQKEVDFLFDYNLEDKLNDAEASLDIFLIKETDMTEKELIESNNHLYNSHIEEVEKYKELQQLKSIVDENHDKLIVLK